MSQNDNALRRCRRRARIYHLRKAAVAALSGFAAVAGVALAAAPSAQADVDWGPIIACESGGNPTAQNPSSTASGLFQFLDSSWAAYGGLKYASRAKNATSAQQYAVANAAYARSGLRPWAASRSCWGGKVRITSAPPAAPPPVVPPATLLTRVLPAPWTGPTTPYVVAGGDTLTAIAAAHHLPNWQALWAANTAIANPDLIFVGQSIRIPDIPQPTK